MNKHPFHKYADLFPMITEPEEWKAFVADIKANGVREPVMLYQGAVLDGRNRHNAAHEAEIDFQTTDFTGDDNAAIDFVISKNIRRRHLTPGQCSALAVDLANMKLGDNQYRKEGFPNEKPSISLSVAVEKVPGATYGTAKRMASVKKADPAIFEEVKKGTITPGAAERKVKAAPKSNGHGKPVPKTTEPIRHYGDGTPKHLDIAKKLDPFFDALWLISADARENATKIENALAERNIIPVTDRKRDARKYLRDLKEKAPKKRNPERAAANAWLDMKDAWLALSGMEQDAFAEVYFKANDDLLRGLYVRTKALAERNRSANFAELAAFEANKTRDSGRQKGSIISDETTNLPAVVNDVSATRFWSRTTSTIKSRRSS